MIKIGFHTNQLGLRGTDVALLDYVYWTKFINGGESIVLTPRIEQKTKSTTYDKQAISHYQKHATVLFYDSVTHLQHLIKSEKLDLFYAIKSGMYDGILSYECPNAIHAVFDSDPHGERYAYVSEWLAEQHQSLDFVPHIVVPPVTKQDYRDYFGIPKDAIVLGWYGGSDSFDIDFAKQVVSEIADKNDNFHFLFMNGKEFRKRSNNVRFLRPNVSRETKSKFINTCDVMLHARERGETFGLAVAEFSAHNKPIFTYQLSKERAHHQMLGSKAVYYTDKSSLENLIRNFDYEWAKTQNWDCYTLKFSPEKVVEQFNRVFYYG